MSFTLFSEVDLYPSSRENNQDSGSERFSRLSCAFQNDSTSWSDPDPMMASARKRQTRTLQHAMHNVNDLISVLKVAKSGIEEVLVVLQRLENLLCDATRGVDDDDHRLSIQLKLETLSRDLFGVVERTTFDGQRLLDGTFKKRNYQTGPDHEPLSVDLEFELSSDLRSLSVLDHGHVTLCQDLVQRSSVDVHIKQQELECTQSTLANRVQSLGTEYFNLIAVSLSDEEAHWIQDVASYSRYAVTSSNERALIAQANLSGATVQRLVRPKTRKHRPC